MSFTNHIMNYTDQQPLLRMSSHQLIRTRYGLLRLELIYDKMYGTQKDVDKTMTQIYAYGITYPWLLEEED